MSQQFRTVTTNAGRNAVREALTQGKTVKLSHMSVGDGGGNPVTPLSTMTKLVNERFRAQINDIVLDPATPDLFTAELFIPQAEGGWYIREVGLWMDAGTLFAVGNTPLTEKPDISSGAATDLLVRLIIRVLDAATVSIEIDPAQVLATREYVDRKLDAHNKDGGAHETLARKSVQIKAGTGLTGGGTLEADRTLTVKYGTGAGTACQGNDARVTASEAFRLSMIGVPRYWRSTTLPAGHVWANGDLALFADWPELKKIYDAGGFAGMLLAYNANSATIAANLGKWRPNAANPTGLYVPNLSEQFFRAWTGGSIEDAGAWHSDETRNITGQFNTTDCAVGGASGAFVTSGTGTRAPQTETVSNTIVTFDASRVVPTGPVNVPPHVWQPVAIYLGLPA